MRFRVLGPMAAACLGLAIATTTMAAPHQVRLWPKGNPGPQNGSGTEGDTTKPSDSQVAGKPVIRMGNVTDPSLAFYPAPSGKNSGTTVVVFPGGAYKILALDLEGTEICDWLNSIGVNAVLVKYRVPEAEGVPRYQAPLQDAQRSLGIVRLHAQERNLDPHRVGVLGFSAGGNLAAVLSTNFDKRSYESVDEADKQSCRPDFAILIYPAYLSPELTERLAPELHVSANMPPTFLVQTEDDPVHVENSLFYYLALKRANVPAEMHLYSKGGHGYGLRRSQFAVTGWPALAEEWLKSLGDLK